MEPPFWCGHASVMGSLKGCLRSHDHSVSTYVAVLRRESGSESGQRHPLVGSRRQTSLRGQKDTLTNPAAL